MSRRARPSAGFFHVVAPVVAVGVDGVGGDNFCGFEGHLYGCVAKDMINGGNRRLQLDQQRGHRRRCG